jgi:hypothetical protein
MLEGEEVGQGEEDQSPVVGIVVVVPVVVAVRVLEVSVKKSEYVDVAVASESSVL